jgi:hypothetical protein
MAALLAELASRPDYRAGAADFDHVVEVLAELVEDGLDHTAAVMLAAKLSGVPVWLFVPTEHEGRRWAREHDLPPHLCRYVTTSSRGLVGGLPRLWLVDQGFYRRSSASDRAAAHRILHDLDRTITMTRNALCGKEV